jgi:hypothetical protein
MKRLWAALLLIPSLLSAQAAGTDNARPITLDEAVSLAHRNAPAAISARGLERTSRQQVNNAYASFIPSLTVSAGGTRQFTNAQTIIRDGQTVTLPSEPWSYSTGLNFGVELFDGGRRFYDLGAARAGVDAAEANYVTQRGCRVDAQRVRLAVDGETDQARLRGHAERSSPRLPLSTPGVEATSRLATLPKRNSLFFEASGRAKEPVVERVARPAFQVGIPDDGQARIEQRIGRHRDAGTDLNLDQVRPAAFLGRELPQLAALPADALFADERAQTLERHRHLLPGLAQAMTEDRL